MLSLWETVAVELAKQIYFQEQEPFECVHQKFRRELSKDEDGEDQYKALDTCLELSDLDLVQGTIFEFIETFIKNCQPQECNIL